LIIKSGGKRAVKTAWHGPQAKPKSRRMPGVWQVPGGYAFWYSTYGGRLGEIPRPASQAIQRKDIYLASE
jgi:hypothetical protein